MDINQLIKIVKKKIIDNFDVENLVIEDKTYLHKKHSGNVEGKFHLKIIIKSKELNSNSKMESNRKIYKLLNYEIKNFIHSIQLILS